MSASVIKGYARASSMDELDVVGSCAINGEYPEALEAIAAGEINVKALTSRIAPLSEGASWFERLHGGEESLLKVILQPD